MAKGNMLLGQARGKVGDIVFSRSNGQQIIKAKSAVVKNPNTEAQVLQRILLNTVAQAYSKMIAICDHSFEGVSTGQATMSTFMAKNLNRLRSIAAQWKEEMGSLNGLYAYSPIGANNLAINKYIISAGSLSPIYVDGFNLASEGAEVVELTVPGATEQLTYADVVAGFNLQRGDQITFVQLTYDAVQGVQFGYARCILDPMDAEGAQLPMSSAFIADGAFANANDRNQGLFARLSDANGKISFSVGGGIPVGAAIIVSRQTTNGEWLRSSSVMQITSSPALYSQWSLLDALNAFYSGGIDMGNAYYLNQAEAGQASVNPVAEPDLFSLTINQYDILDNSLSTFTTDDTEQTLHATVHNFPSSGSVQIIFSSRSYSIGSTIAAQAGDTVVNITSGSYTNDSFTLPQADLLHTYFVVNNQVKDICRNVSVENGGPSNNTNG